MMPNTDLDFARGEHWLSQVFQFEPDLRSALRAASSSSPQAEGAVAQPPSGSASAETRVDDLLLDTYARILTAASDPTFAPVCLKAFALRTACEVAGLASPPDESDSEEDLAPLIALVRALPTLTRQVFTLRKVYDCSVPDIAARLKLTVSDVESHLVAAACACTTHWFACARPPTRN